MYYLDPIEPFVNEHLERMAGASGTGKRPSTSPLFNGVIGDRHFSAIGSELWARVAGERLGLLLGSGDPEEPPDREEPEWP